MTRNSLPAAILAFSATNFATLNQHHRKLFLLSSMWRKFHNATIITKKPCFEAVPFPGNIVFKIYFSLIYEDKIGNFFLELNYRAKLEQKVSMKIIHSRSQIL